MPNRSLTTERVLTLLAKTPPRIITLTADMVPAQMHAKTSSQLD